jgi:hypothetical protein
MSVSLKFKVEADREYINVFDITEQYSSSNIGGWGLPNTQISEVTGCQLRVYFPGENSFLVKDLFPILPNIDSVGKQLEASMFGKESFPAGIYRFDMICNAGSIEISSSIQFYHYRPLECCISAKKSKVSITDVKSDKAVEVLELEALLENSIWAASVGDRKSVAEIVEYISIKCECCGCGC